MLEDIESRLSALIANCKEPSLREAMDYSLFTGGKRLRPMLLLGACESAMGRYDQVALDFACALEMIHTYSLIHDDLPAMDNDQLRRGMPTSHVKFGEAMAILAGDALLNRAYETMAGARNLEAMLTIATAAGDNGMIAGQVNDIHFQNKELDADTLFDIHCKKTGALFSAALKAGALIGGGGPAYVQAMEQVGVKLGWAFQIFDDLLDITSGKESDAKNKKYTYVSVHGFDAAKADYKRISASALECLDNLPHKTDTLRKIVVQVIDRER